METPVVAAREQNPWLIEGIVHRVRRVSRRRRMTLCGLACGRSSGGFLGICVPEANPNCIACLGG